MKKHYHPHQIEKEAQKYWEENNSFAVTEDESKEKYFCLSMFPYPSGRLHIGHVRNYTIGDVISRYQRMQGKNVLQPMGWDAFGLPAENAAIKNKTSPALWTYTNIDYMKNQLKRLGFGYDWNRELTTCKPDYYKWEQWFFTNLYKKGMVYKKMSFVHWCPNDNTVLANEQIDNGRCWRCDTIVERKELAQWFINITAYADELLADLDQLKEWPEQVKTMQRNWIGRSEGVCIIFQLVNPTEGSQKVLKIYTTRPDILMGVSYLSISTDHPLAKVASVNNVKLGSFIEEYKNNAVTEIKTATMEKTGIDTGLRAMHPITGKEVPIWMVNDSTNDSTNAIMAIPAHCQCDYEFATRFELPINQVIQPVNGEECNLSKAAFTKPGKLINSGEFNGLSSKVAWNVITNKLIAVGKGKKQVNYRLRDWNVSRQRYWGVPIPIRYLEDDTPVTVPMEDLPVLLPEKIDMASIHSSLKIDSEWTKTMHKGQAATRETDTFDTFMESSWYYARYCSPQFNDQMLNSKAANYWLPVDQYIGGIEHAIMHLLYSRFFHKLLRDTGLVDSDEPFKKLLCQGMVLADTFYRLDDKRLKHWISPNYVDFQQDKKRYFIKATLKKTGETVKYAGMQKMSKSKNNGIDPQQLINRYGADTIRFYTMFAAPPEQNLEWSENAVEGAHRFLRRFWKQVSEHLVLGDTPTIDINNLSKQQKDLRRKTHETIQKVSDDCERRLRFNTAIAAIMELNNTISKFKDTSDQGRAVLREALEATTLMLAPIAPHAMHSIWKAFGHINIIEARWPTVDKSALEQDTVTILIQVNGKLRAKQKVPATLNKDSITAIALAHVKVIKFIQSQKIRKVIVIPGKLVNIVTD